jgi:ATP-binding cassette subfamily F protein 3
MEDTVGDFFMNQTNISFDRSFGILERFLFPKDLRNYKLKTLSPGQRARLSFAIFAQGSYDFLILDEPTNHLDIRTKEVIEESLKQFRGAVLLISHDRYFVREIGISRIITIKDQKIVDKQDI